ncbi:MAG: SAM-dependent methyltransferase [Thermodesulfovibrionales bacterium]|jgi:hypothetical protein
MSFTLDKIVPWGRSYEEYLSMFSLSKVDLNLYILGCADGPSSFNYGLTKRGGKIISVDPLYQLTKEQIAQRIKDTLNEVLEQTQKNESDYVWTTIHSIEELGRLRTSAMQEFLDDYERGLRESRYMAESLPSLSFADKQFQLALCSHFLFLYSDQLNLDFHINSIREMCRVAHEVRIFPLLKLSSEPSPYLEPVIKSIEGIGYKGEITAVKYEFQRGGNKMMKIRKT